MGGVKAVVLLLALSSLAIVTSVTPKDVEEIRHFAFKAYGGKGPDKRAPFSHYVGRRMKALHSVQTPFTVYMKPAVRPLMEPQSSAAVNTYSFAPFSHPNFLAPPPPYGRPFKSPPPKFQFRPSFSFSFPPGPPPRFPKPPGYHAYPAGLPVRNIPFEHHSQKLQAVMNNQHRFIVEQAKTQVIHSGDSQQGEGNKTEEVKINEVKPTKQPETLKANQVTKFSPGISYAPQTFETIPPEIFTRHLHPSEYTVTLHTPPGMADTRFPVPIRYEHATPMTFQYGTQTQPVQMTTVYQSEAFPEYSFHSGLNPANFMTFPSFIATPSIAPIAKPTPTPAQSPKPSGPAHGTEESSEAIKLTDSSTPAPTVQEVVFESARIPEEVARRPGSAFRNRPQPLSPQEQRNIFTAAADSSMVVAPLVYSEDYTSPLGKKENAPEVLETVTPQSTSTRRSVTRSKKEDGGTSTVTKIMAGGKRVRFRKVRVSSKAKVEAASS